MACLFSVKTIVAHGIILFQRASIMQQPADEPCEVMCIQVGSSTFPNFCLPGIMYTCKENNKRYKNDNYEHGRHFFIASSATRCGSRCQSYILVRTSEVILVRCIMAVLGIPNDLLSTIEYNLCAAFLKSNLGCCRW